jgi:8-oxo-dGTP pyrophosphatase MutT (NUDIX family)
VQNALAEYLRGLDPAAREYVEWIDADCASYLTQREPPLSLVTSVRAVVCRGEAVLVFDDASGAPHVVPGGRRESGESLRATLERELREETGCTIVGELILLGAMHFRLRSLPPAEYRYPHFPDFLQLVYAVATRAEPIEPEAHVDARAPRFVPRGALVSIALRPCERAFVAPSAVAAR